MGAAQFLALRTALNRYLGTAETPDRATLDRLFLECGLPSEWFGVDVWNTSDDALTTRLVSLGEDLEIFAQLADHLPPHTPPRQGPGRD